MTSAPHLAALKQRCPLDKNITVIKYLRKNGLDDFGSVIIGEKMRKATGINYPETASKSVFDALALAELALVHSARSILLKEGKYLTQTNGDYRILLPSENVRQVQAYIKSAKGKLKRAGLLIQNTPPVDDDLMSIGRQNTRIHMLAESAASMAKRVEMAG